MRKIESKIDRWPGYIGLPDPLTYPQGIIIADMIDAIADIGEKYNDKKSLGVRFNNVVIPFLFSLVEEWGIEGIEQDPDKFPFVPRKDADEFIGWWYQEVVALTEDDKSKNE
jgi:hypothetical protein